MNFSEAMFYYYLSSDFHTNTVFTPVCLLVKMATKTVIRPIWDTFQIGLEFRSVGFEEREKPEYPEKNLSEQRQEPTTHSPTCDAESGNRTRAILVGGECSHHCAIPDIT